MESPQQFSSHILTNRNEMTKRTWKLEDVERIQVSGDVVYFIARSGT